MNRAKHIVIAGEIFSSNLGDGVIAETLAFLFKKIAPDVQLGFLDISGRTSWETSLDGFPLPSWLSSLNQRLSSSSSRAYKSALNLLKWVTVKRRRYTMRNWQPILSRAEALVIGGGQVLQDNYLDFPLKISSIASLATDLGLDIHFSACGIGKQWSPVALLLFRKAVTHASTITVRDSLSLERLQRFIPQMAQVPLATLDPAIWAATVYGLDGGKRNHAGSLIGLGVIGLREVNMHAPRGRTFTQRELLGFWLEVIQRLQQGGFGFEVFTNGSVPDHALAEEIARAAKDELSIVCPVAERPVKPRDLVVGISHYGAVVASRLHSNIIAASCGIPATGIAWDEKVRAFYQDTGREGLCLDIYGCDPDSVVETLLLSIGEGIDERELEQWKDRALENARIVVDKQYSACELVNPLDGKRNE